jgi:DNA-binding PadR family transcriptional regulator
MDHFLIADRSMPTPRLGSLTALDARVARAEPRPPRKYYELTSSGRETLADALKRFRLLDAATPARPRRPRPSNA